MKIKKEKKTRNGAINIFRVSVRSSRELGANNYNRTNILFIFQTFKTSQNEHFKQHIRTRFNSYHNRK